MEGLKQGRDAHLCTEFSRKFAIIPFSYLDAPGLSLQQNEESEIRIHWELAEHVNLQTYLPLLLPVVEFIWIYYQKLTE